MTDCSDDSKELHIASTVGMVISYLYALEWIVLMVLWGLSGLLDPIGVPTGVWSWSVTISLVTGFIALGLHGYCMAECIQAIVPKKGDSMDQLRDAGLAAVLGAVALVAALSTLLVVWPTGNVLYTLLATGLAIPVSCLLGGGLYTLIVGRLFHSRPKVGRLVQGLRKLIEECGICRDNGSMTLRARSIVAAAQKVISTIMAQPALAHEVEGKFQGLTEALRDALRLERRRLAEELSVSTKVELEVRGIEVEPECATAETAHAQQQ